MGIFSKKSKEEELKESLNSLSELVKSLDLLLSVTNDSAIKTKLKKLQEEIKYSIPTVNKEAKEIEERIKNKLGDLKILITQNIYTSKILQIISEINTLLIERNNKS